MTKYLKPVVAEVSPNLYTAAKTANLSQTQLSQVEQMSYAIKKHRELAKLDTDMARKEFDRLDETGKAQLEFLFKDAEYMKPPETAADKIQGVLGGVLKVAASPLIGLIKLGGQYNRILNTPYKVARQVAQGEDLFSGKTWTDAWGGVDMYDVGALDRATKYFGESDVAVAKGLLLGQTPGEIIEANGNATPELLASIKKASDQPEEFKQVLDGVKYAQISPGRDIARMLGPRPPSSGGLMGDYISGTTKNISGYIDFTYQIAIDPLTWLTGGLSKGVTKGDRIAATVTEMINKGVPVERAIDSVFKSEPRLVEFWEKGLGPALKTFSEAATPAAKKEAFADISQRFPGYANLDAVRALTTKDQHLPMGVVDAASAQKYFENAANLNLMLAGRVDGVTYMRTGVAVARTRRLFGDGLTRYLDSVFNTTSKTTFAGKGRSVEETDEAMEPIYKTLLNSQDAIERLANPMLSDMKVLLEANEQIKGWKRIGFLAARSPASLEVRLGDNAASTAANFTARARQVLPKDMAQALTFKFIDSPMDEQIVILRNLDAAIMYSMGLGGDVRGIELMEKVLGQKYGDLAGFASKVETPINPDHAKVMPEGSIRTSESGMSLAGDGPIHPYQSTDAVGSLPYDEIGSMVWEIKSKKNVINAVGGATQGRFSKNIVDAWSILTLFPRLGVRSAIDEATMFVLAAPTRDLKSFARRVGYKMGNISKTTTGSKAATGPIRESLQKLFQFGGTRSVTIETLGKKIKISPEDALSIERRVAILEDLAATRGIEAGLLENLEKREAIVDEVFKIYNRYLDEDSAEYLRQALLHQPDALTAIANSVVARSGLSGQFGDEVQKALLTPTQLDRAMEAAEVKFNPVSRAVDMVTLAERDAALVHFEKFVKRFVGNKFKVKSEKGGELVTKLNPADIFFRYDGLRPGATDKNGVQMFELALDAGMRSVGFKWDDFAKKWIVEDERVAGTFIRSTADSVRLRAMGKTDDEIARIQLSRIFADMFETFHGSSVKFNDELFNLVNNNYRELTKAAAGTEIIPTWNQAVAKVSIDDFSDATNGFRLTGTVTTQLGVGNLADVENVFRRYGNTMMDWMDRQVTGIFRQPAVMVAYTGLRKKYKGIESEYARQVYQARTGKVWDHTIGEASKDADMAFAISLAEKRFTEIATREAADTILKFADNPAIRSNFAFASRTMGRYYRATEDFYRRIYRMKDVAPRALYRARLAHIGVDATGMVHIDSNGDPYVIMPMDGIIFKATDGTIRALTGQSGYSQPQFNEFTLKLRMLNPSFSQDAGVPTLSGPIAGLSVLAIKNLLGVVPGSLPFIGDKIDPTMEKIAEGIDTFALGNIGDNVDFVRATVPGSLQRIWAILPYNEKSRQEVTAAQQAMAYNAANGLYLTPTATEQEKSEYLKNIRISAHNIIVMRNVLGLISPVAPTMQDSKGIPDYIKDTGITSLRSEFFDILNGITKTNDGDIEDPYELALATFIGKNPGKLIYTVSPTTKQSKVVIRNTDKLKNWAIQNKGLIETYGETAYIFAPQIGDFNAATYNWIKAAGLIENKSLENYYEDLMVAQDKQAYYQIADKQKEMLANESDPQLRANIIIDATKARNALKSANPLLTPALIGEGNNIGDEELMLGKLDQMVSTPNVSMPPATRERMRLAIKMMREYIAFARDPELANIVNSVELKAERKDQIEAALKELMVGDLYVTEANRAIFRSILGFYSRDSYFASRELR